MLTPAELEMQLRLADVAGRTDPSDYLAASDLLAAFDQNLVAMGVRRNPAIVVLDENEIAISSQLVAGIGDDAGIDGFNRGAARRGDVDAIVVRPVGFAAISRDNTAANRPDKRATAGA